MPKLEATSACKINGLEKHQRHAQKMRANCHTNTYTILHYENTKFELADQENLAFQTISLWLLCHPDELNFLSQLITKEEEEEKRLRHV